MSPLLSLAYWCMIWPMVRRLEAHLSWLGWERGAPRAGRSIPISTAMMPMTTRSSTRVKARTAARRTDMRPPSGHAQRAKQGDMRWAEAYQVPWGKQRRKRATGFQLLKAEVLGFDVFI